MGHRFSKTAANNIAAKTLTTNEKAFNTTTNTRATTNIIPIPNGNQQQQFLGHTINLQIQESPTTTCNNTSSTDNITTTTTPGILQQQQQQPYNTNNSISSSSTSVNNLSCGRQIIIKIQLAKMENGNEIPTSSTSLLSQHQQQQQPHTQTYFQQDTSLESLTADCNLNSTELSTTVAAASTQFFNLTLNSGSSSSNCNPTTATATTSSSTCPLTASASLFRTAGSSLNKNNNYLSSNSGTSVNVNNGSIMFSSRNERPERFNSLQFNDEIVDQNIGEIVEYCEVLEQQQQQPQTSGSSCNSIQMLSINEGKKFVQ